MKIFEKRKTFLLSTFTKELRLFNYPVWAEKKTPFYRQVKVFKSFTLFKVPHRNYPFYDNNFKSFEQFSNDFVQEIKSHSKPVILWIDHSLQGGTEVYSQDQFKKLCTEYTIIRVQYYLLQEAFVITVPQSNMYTGYTTDFYELKNLLNDFLFSRVILNSLVSYCNVAEILNYISDLKCKTANLFVSCRAHDYHPLCPSFNLMNSEQRFCNLKCSDCEDCLLKKKSGLDKYDQALFLGSYTGIAQWRAVFSEFFKNTADEMIVFSDAVVPYFTKIYPDLLHKIKVIPHYVAPLTVPHIPKHQDINICVIGNITTVCKGRLILEKICEDLATKENVNLFCFGEFNSDHDYEKLKVLGPYKRDNLPSLIEQHNIDVILIPSVWPETFSYTTSEAIAMGIKVACFNYGAQAEKVKEYKKGLILNENEDNITDKLIAFVKEPLTNASNCSLISKAVECTGK